ncbi:MAG: B12-binding domain-containing radical SAM protein [Ignavibacteriaceae bacterium]
MNVLLINPGASNIYSKVEANLPPLGIAYLASVARKGGHNVHIVDANVEKKVLGKTDLNYFDVVGITSDTPRYYEALKIAKEIKKTGKFIVMGGYHVTFLDEEVLSSGYVDVVVRGEGEEIFLNLLNALENNTGLKTILGISYLEGEKFVRNDDALPPKNLDELPFPARDLLPISKYKTTLNGIPSANLITSRGCPYNCYFCASSKFGGIKWRARSAKNIVDEMEMLYNDYGYRAFEFLDDNFTLSKKRIFAFADELEKRKMTDIIWWCFSRVDTIAKNEPMVKRMAEVGAYRVFLGLESVNENVLDSYGKNIDNEEQTKAIHLLRKYGIGIHGSFIVGDINETKEMIMKTVNWAKKMNPQLAQFSLLTPFPGTQLYDDIKKENKFLHNDWRLFDALHPTIKLNNLSPVEAQKLIIDSYKKFYISFSRFFDKPKPYYREGMPKGKFKLFDAVFAPIILFVQFRKEMYRNSKVTHNVEKVNPSFIKLK